MLGWVISCHDDRAQEMLEGLEKKYGPLARRMSPVSGISSRKIRLLCCCMIRMSFDQYH